MNKLPLSKSNQAVSLRLCKIMQCGLSWETLSKILIEVTNQDRSFIAWLNHNAPSRTRDMTILDKFESAYSKQTFTRFPWFGNGKFRGRDVEGKLMVKVSTIEEIEKQIVQVKKG